MISLLKVVRYEIISDDKCLVSFISDDMYRDEEVHTLMIPCLPHQDISLLRSKVLEPDARCILFFHIDSPAGVVVPEFMDCCDETSVVKSDL